MQALIRMKPFAERDQLKVGAAGVAAIAAALILTFNLNSLPLIGGGETYTAAFSEASGLTEGSEVRVAGIRVGKVTRIYLADGHVNVRFTVSEPVELGRDTTASVQVKTLLGLKFLGLDPEGPGELGPEIPLSRTTPAYDVVEAFADLTTTTEKIDVDQLAAALDTVATTFRDTPPEVKATLDGVARLSGTLASRDAELKSLLKNSRTVSGVLADRTDELTRLIKDGRLLFGEIQARRGIIHRLLVDTSALATQLTGLVGENRAQVGPALQNLHGVLTMLQQNKDNLDKSVRLIAPYARLFNNTVGNGPWFDGYIPNLVAPLPASPQLPGGAR